MGETLLLYVWIVKILLVVICAVLWRLGGASGFSKAFRRFLMPFIYIAGCSGIAVWKGTFSYWILLSLPLLIFSLSRGYGATDFWTKVRRRALYGFGLGISFLPFAFVSGNWILYTWHFSLCMLGSISWGVYNPSAEGAVGEEATIATLSLLMPVLMI